MWLEVSICIHVYMYVWTNFESWHVLRSCNFLIRIFQNVTKNGWFLGRQGLGGGMGANMRGVCGYGIIMQLEKFTFRNRVGCKLVLQNFCITDLIN